MIRTGLLSIPTLDDACTDAIIHLLRSHVPEVMLVHEASVGHQQLVIEETLRRWSDESELDLILTLGGTLPAPGPSARNVTPEATLAVIERAVPGLSETMRMSVQEENPFAPLDRGVAGIRGRTLIVNLPGGVHSAALFLAAVIDLLPAVLAHLHDQPDAPVPDDWYAEVGERSDSEAIHGLNPDEFRAFLARNRTDSDTESP